MLFIHNEQRVLHDVAIFAMITIGQALGFSPEQTAKDLRVRWVQEDGKWSLAVDVLVPVPTLTEEQQRDIIVGVGREARALAILNRRVNATTRFHG